MSAFFDSYLSSIEIVHGDFRFVGLPPDKLLAAGVPADLVLSAVKDRLKVAIDSEAERVRLALVTPGAGQAMEYQEVQAQATAALKAPVSASAEKYPMLAASIGIDVDPETGLPAVDVLGVANSVNAARNFWISFGSQIRSARLLTKKAVDEATTVESAMGAAASAAWPTSG